MTSTVPTIEVRPLPPAPPGFSGAVGHFTLVSKVVPTTTAVGEPVTWTVELSGTGNWPDIPGLPAREVSKDFQIVQPKAKRKPVDKGKLFDATLTEDVVLVPTVAGAYVLEPVRFTYFDPKSGEYRTIETPRTTVTVTGASAARGRRLRPPPPAHRAPPDSPPSAPDLPAGLPRDPAFGPASASAPWDPLVLGSARRPRPSSCSSSSGSGLPCAGPRQNDPHRAPPGMPPAPGRHARRAAHGPSRERSRAPRSWQHDTAFLWDIPLAAPVAEAVPNATWSALWAESDRALYGPAAGAAVRLGRTGGGRPGRQEGTRLRPFPALPPAESPPVVLRPGPHRHRRRGPGG